MSSKFFFIFSHKPPIWDYLWWQPLFLWDYEVILAFIISYFQCQLCLLWGWHYTRIPTSISYNALILKDMSTIYIFASNSEFMTAATAPLSNNANWPFNSPSTFNSMKTCPAFPVDCGNNYCQRIVFFFPLWLNSTFQHSLFVWPATPQMKQVTLYLYDWDGLMVQYYDMQDTPFLWEGT